MLVDFQKICSILQTLNFLFTCNILITLLVKYWEWNWATCRQSYTLVTVDLSQLCDIRVRRSSLFPWSWASSELTLSVMDSRPHLLHNLPLLSRFLHRFLHRYKLILLGGRSTRVWTTCLRLIGQQCSSWSRTCDLLIASLTLYL